MSYNRKDQSSVIYYKITQHALHFRRMMALQEQASMSQIKRSRQPKSETLIIFDWTFVDACPVFTHVDGSFVDMLCILCPMGHISLTAADH